ncbi:metabotropic glutamate receptor 1 isoform X1 [Daphnia magna]|uniref:metabotropic glutamate receptor 1 isoform X1 n=1 Tax=Daphnia magna TaxID=35525 RepID=UPI001E1BADBB|nr:metabotropic glutamate receptor 1 isoform X1 [Daphnia magna]
MAIVFKMLPTFVMILWMATVLQSPVTGQWTQRKTAILEGDMTIGYLFSMHEQPDQKSAHMRTCGRIWEEYGIQRAEATFQTIERINKDPTILPGIRLGVEIRDDCWYAPVALEQTLEFIRDAVAASPAAATTTSSGNSNYQTATSPAPPVHPSACSKKNKESCSTSTTTTNNNKRRKVLVGVIGPGSSAVSIQVQNLLQLFHIPQIGYSATSRDLSDKNRFGYFLRVVPPDELQAMAMLQIVQRYNWTYVSAVSTEGSYGESGLQVFREYADREGICVAKEYSILSNDVDHEYDRLLMRIMEEPKARVIVCFCEGETVNAILKAIRRFNQTGHFLLVGSDGWADRLDVVQGYEAEAEGGISIRIHSPPVASFDRDYFALKPDAATRARNPWFQEFWEHRFDCLLPDSNSSPTAANHSLRPLQVAGNNKKLCTGEESLRGRYKQDTKMGFVIKATMAMAWALHHLQQSVCGTNSSGMCPDMLPIDGSLLRDHLLNVSFPYGTETVQFDSNGNPPGWYDIMNYQRHELNVSSSNPSGVQQQQYGYVQIGSWRNGTLDMPDWPAKMVTSVCSEPCQKGQIKIIQKELSCCWQCVTCDAHQRVLNETACQDCQWGYWPDLQTNECKEITAEFGKWSDVQSIVAVTLSVVGLLATLATAAVFAWHNNTPVVKASTRELTYIILVGMALCYLTTFPLLAVPSKLSCTLSRILPGFSFSLIFAALLTKTNRIARILAGSKKRICTRKSRWLSLTAQILITMTMIGVELILIVSMLILEPADAVKFYPSRSRVLIICDTTTRGLIAPLGFDFFLIGMCTVYAVKTRNLPENFNEAKFIGFAMYTTCVIWVAFVPIYFSGNESKTITLCMCVSLSAVVTLVLLFGPKLYIIIFKPEKNNRSAFTTSADLRIHIVGGTQMKYNANQSSAFSSSSNHATQSTIRGSSITNHDQSWGDGPHRGNVSRVTSNRLTNDSTKSIHHALPADQPAGNTNGDSKSRTNMTFLRRAFGSQLDLVADSSSLKMRNSSRPLLEGKQQLRSVEVQTDDLYLITSAFPPQLRRTNVSESSDSENEHDALMGGQVSPNSWPHRRWASITEKQVPDEEDAADIIINLGSNKSSVSLAHTAQHLATQPLNDCPAVGFRLSQSAASSIVRLDGDAWSDSNEAYYRLQSLGIIVCKTPSSTDIL